MQGERGQRDMQKCWTLLTSNQLTQSGIWMGLVICALDLSQESIRFVGFDELSQQSVNRSSGVPEQVIGNK